MSVAAMTCLSYLYVKCMEAVHVAAFVYVDNWAYHSGHTAPLANALDSTVIFAEAFSLTVDWNKSWCWGTTQRMKDFWINSDTLRDHYDADVPLVQSASELGVMRIYGKKPAPAALHKRISKGVERSKRIRAAADTVRSRAAMVQRCIWPLALYSAETQYVSISKMKELRRAGVNAVVGPWKQASTWVACHYLSKELQDPLLYVIINLLCLLRAVFDFLPEKVRFFLRLLNDRPYTRSYGPVSACSMYLHQLGWELDAQGTLHGPPWLPKISVTNCSRKEIKRTLVQWWSVQVWQQSKHRRGIPSLPWDRDITLKVLDKFEDRDFAFLATRITNAFLSGAARALFREPIEGVEICEKCGGTATVRHALCECPEAEHVRKGHGEAVRFLEDNEAFRIFPLPPVSAGGYVLQKMLGDQQGRHTIQIGAPVGEELVFFTDGSCTHPTIPLCRRASWAVVQALDVTNEEIGRQFTLDRPDVPFYERFRCSGCGFVHGHQTIDRGELSCIVAIFNSVQDIDYKGHIRIHTDSRYVCTCLDLVWNAVQSERLQGKRAHNFDLLLHLFSNWPAGRVTWTWVKAHREISEASCPVDAWRIIGNATADKLAGAALVNDSPQVHVAVQEVRHEFGGWLTRLAKVFAYFVELDKWSVSWRRDTPDVAIEEGVADTVAGSSQAAVSRFKQMQKRLGDWKVVESLFIPFYTPEDDLFRAIPAGQKIARAVWSWMHTIRWPRQGSTQRDDVGITYLELLANFYLFSGMRLPVVFHFERKSSLTSFRDYDSAETQMLPCSAKAASQQYTTLTTIMQQLNDVTRNWSLPGTKQSLLKERKIFYPLRQCGTFVSRPEIDRASETVNWVINYCSKLDGDMAGKPLEMPSGPFQYTADPFDEPDLPTPQRKWQFKKRKKFISLAGA